MVKRLASIPVLLGLFASAAATAQKPPAAPAAGHAVPGWYLGMPVLLRALPVPEGVDRKTLPNFRVYVHAPVSATAGAAPMKSVTRPDGSVVALPPHQDTLAALNAPDAPRLGIGYFVLRGSKGTEETVRTQPQPAKSWPSSPLVSEIRIGPEWVKVNNHAVVEYGLAAELLKLEFFDVGGQMWGELYDPAAAATATVNCALVPQPTAPPVDWINDRNYVPGQTAR